jgi:prepilin-type processing-associated H-X9-DG protein
VTDGLSNPYFASEKFLDPENYTNGLDTGDHEFATCGMDNDNLRSGSAVPAMDYTLPGGGTPDTDTLWFGSPHATGVNMVYCDGSVHCVSYQIDQKTHAAFANRADGIPPNWKYVTP